MTYSKQKNSKNFSVLNLFLNRIDASPLSNALSFKAEITKKIPDTNFAIHLLSSNSLVLNFQELTASYKINEFWKIKAGI